MQRNLYQHSNITNLWYDQIAFFVGSLRYHIMEDVKSNPGILKVEDLFSLNLAIEMYKP